MLNNKTDYLIEYFANNFGFSNKQTSYSYGNDCIYGHLTNHNLYLLQKQGNGHDNEVHIKYHDGTKRGKCLCHILVENDKRIRFASRYYLRSIKPIQLICDDDIKEGTIEPKYSLNINNNTYNIKFNSKWDQTICNNVIIPDDYFTQEDFDIFIKYWLSAVCENLSLGKI